MKRTPMTVEGYETLDSELKVLKSVERPSIIQAISEARAHGDLSENAEYHAAKEKQSFVEGRIAELEDKLSRADVIDVRRIKGDRVVFGATVDIADIETEDKATYRIVGEDEADIGAGKISNTSPLARALIGKTIGDEVEVAAPGGVRVYEIVAVDYI